MDCESEMPSPQANAIAEAPTREAWKERYTKLPKDELWRLLAYANESMPSDPAWCARLDELYEYAREHKVTLGPRSGDAKPGPAAGIMD